MVSLKELKHPRNKARGRPLFILRFRSLAQIKPSKNRSDQLPTPPLTTISGKMRGNAAFCFNYIYLNPTNMFNLTQPGEENL